MLKNATDNANCEVKREERTWKNIVFDFLNLVGSLKNEIKNQAEQAKKRMVLKVVSIFVIILGFIFVAVGFAHLINLYTGERTWIGFMAVGLALIAISQIIFSKK